MVDTACSVIASGQAKAHITPIDINTFHCTYGHTHEMLLKKEAAQQGVNLSGELHECRGSSTAKELRKSIVRSMHTRVDKKQQRVFIDLSGKITVPSIGGKRYTLFVLDDCTRYTRVYFLSKKSDAASPFKSFLAEVRADGIPSAVLWLLDQTTMKRFSEGISGNHAASVVPSKSSRQQTAPKYNVVAERALALINDAALAARIQAPILYPGAPSYPSLWAEVVSWACHVLNRTAITANPGDKSSYEMSYGSPPAPEEV